MGTGEAATKQGHGSGICPLPGLADILAVRVQGALDSPAP